MIRKSIGLAVCRCEECGTIMVYKPALEDLPPNCQKCGLGRNVELTTEERKQMERARDQPNVSFQTIRF